MRYKIHIATCLLFTVVSGAAVAETPQTGINLKLAQEKAGAVAPSSLKEQQDTKLPAVQKKAGAITPRDLKEQGQAPRLPAVQDKSKAVSPSGLKRPQLPTAKPGGVGSPRPISDDDAPRPPGIGREGLKLPEALGKQNIPGPGDRLRGGALIGCDGPDPALSVQVRRLRGPDGGPYNFWLAVYITNQGREAFNSSRGQTLLTVKDGANVLESEPWPAADPIELSPGDRISKVLTISDWHAGTGEFVSPFIVQLSYDPDIGLDGNPDNDDCNSRNNKIEVTSEEIKALLDSGTGWHWLR